MLNKNNPEAYESLLSLQKEMRAVATPQPAYMTRSRPGEKKPVEGPRSHAAPGKVPVAGSADALAPRTPGMKPTLAPKLPIRSPIAVETSTPSLINGTTDTVPARTGGHPHPQLPELSPTQLVALEYVSKALERNPGGLTQLEAHRALVRAVANLPRQQLNRSRLYDALFVELLRHQSPLTSRLAATSILHSVGDQNLCALSPVAVAKPPERRLPRASRTTRTQFTPAPRSTTPPKKTKPPKRPKAPITDMPVHTVSFGQHPVDFDSAKALRLLRETDVARDFKTILDTLRLIFTQLHGSGQPHATRLFLEAADNRFAIVVPKESLRESRSRYPKTTVMLSDIQRLPTTRGFVILEGGNRLAAWRVTPDSAEISTIELNALRTYLTKLQPPQMTYEVIGPRQRSAGSGLRDLAGIAGYLRERESGLRPLTVDGNGRTSREWTEKQLRRMGEKSPHRVREHFRKVPSTGEKTIVSEHSRYGPRGWTNTTVRMFLL